MPSNLLYCTLVGLAFSVAVAVENNPTGDPIAAEGALDKHALHLEGRTQVPLNVWLARPNSAPHAQDSVAVADMLFNDSGVGVEFIRSAKIRPVPARYEIRGDCDLLPLPDDVFVAGELNVYFVADEVINAHGLNCRNDRNVIFIGQHEMDDTLAHEIGHAFGLNDDGCRAGGCSESYHGHPNDLPSFDRFGSANVMSRGNSGRSRFTAGQALRMNLHAGSMLNVNGHREGPTRNCPGDLTNEECPPLDWSGEMLE